jgi:hypothetical protein
MRCGDKFFCSAVVLRRGVGEWLAEGTCEGGWVACWRMVGGGCGWEGSTGCETGV